MLRPFQSAQNKIHFRVMACLILLLGVNQCAIANIAYSELETEFAEISQKAYSYYSKNDPTGTLKRKDATALYRHVKAAFETGENQKAISLINANLELIRNNIDKSSTDYFLTNLLRNNELSTVNELVNYANYYGDTYTQSKANFHLAKHHFNRKNWKQAQEYLQAIEVRNALTNDEGDYATLIFGISLQQQKLHREAAKIYDSIEDNSKYYGHAQLNKAVAYIRQDWWTDAHVAIESVLNDNLPDELDEFTNRLLLVLGHSQLKNEFYRDARNTFRKIDLESQYVNKALLGIGLCALHQGDYIGAANAFEILKSKPDNDLPIAESYLLVPFVHVQMGQPTLATTLYSEAVSFYNKQLKETNKQIASLENHFSKGRNITDYNSTLKQLPKLVLQQIPQFLLSEYKSLTDFESSINDPKLNKEINALILKYSEVIFTAAKSQLNRYAEQIRSYMSQSQFGLAKLYDSN